MRPPANIFAGGGHDNHDGTGYVPAAFPVTRNILIENNTIIDSPGPPLDAWACENVAIRNNRIIAEKAKNCDIQGEKSYD
ncbi:MAG TPA: hypothetical protein DD727_03405 [Clostridiales bacterium]|nr:hypothetical protein [Clostridiales bacterium]